MQCQILEILQKYSINRNCLVVREKKSFKDRNIVIVCEGSTTEYNYISEACEYAKTIGRMPFTNVIILPINEKPISTNPNRRKQKRHLMGNKDECRYYSKVDTLDNYEKYKGQPTRYLREAQLFIEEDGFVEGWAIYDKDKHTDHAGAIELLDTDSRLKVAFSSYSFEEWLLCHFERNLTQFNKSECCDNDGHSYQCGCDNSDSANCNGIICIAGRLRKYKYIPEYSKTQTDLFKNYSLAPSGTLSEIPLINAAWIRFKQNGQIRFDANPYTDVDILLLHLLDDSRIFRWFSGGEAIKLSQGEIVISKKDKVACITNISNKNVLLPKNCIKKYMSDGNIQSLSFTTIFLSPQQSVDIEIDDCPCLRIDFNPYYFFIEI